MDRISDQTNQTLETNGLYQLRPFRQEDDTASPASSQHGDNSPEQSSEDELWSPVIATEEEMEQLTAAMARLSTSAAISSSQPAVSVAASAFSPLKTATRAQSASPVRIVNHTGNTTINFGRDVLNNNYVINHVYSQKQEAAMKIIKSVLGDNFVSAAADYEQPSYAGCMPGTRTGVLSKFIKWVTDDPMAIFWLAGMAGMGKTSIAVTLCRMLRKNPAILFGGGYFCSRSAGSIARTDVRRILPTLAGVLADQSETFAEALASELEKDRNLGHKPVSDQMGPLLRQPLRKLASSSHTVVFLIDALDECKDVLELAELLRLIADPQFDRQVKFILTSRPELHIRGTPISNPEHNTILQLHTISVDEVTSDIRLYITGTLNNIAPQASWYADQDIDTLTRLSAGLFIFASTVLKYVLYPTGDEDRQDRLRKATTASAKGPAGTSSIDKIYELILADVSQPEITEDDELERMKHVLACILSARAPLSVEALASLIGISSGRLHSSLGRLHSLVHLPDEDTLPGVRTLHASLGDYLFQRAPPRLRIATTIGHDLFVRGCLRRLAKDDLCFNVSRCRSSFEPTPNGIAAKIPLSLAYACLHWAHHIVSASYRCSYDEEIGRIFRAKFLFWLEVTCVLGKVGLASGLLRIAGSAVHNPVTSQFLHDANVFVASSYAAISRSIPHIYISALPFAAKDSLVYRDFVPLCTGLVSVTTFGIDRHGGRLVTNLVGHEDAVNSVSYSGDSRLVSGSSDGTVRIWDTLTGEECIPPLRSNDGKIFTVAFASDGHRVASGGESRVVHVWSLATGQPALPALQHSGGVQSVTFSPDGTLIASGSENGEVCLWSSKTGQNMSTLKAHEFFVSAVAFSPDGKLVASASWDKPIRLWNARTGEMVGDLLVGLDLSDKCIAFSPDGKRLVGGAGYQAGGIIWHIEKPGSDTVTIATQSSMRSIVFSPDGSKIFSAGDQKTIQCWDSQNGSEVPGSSLAGHAVEVRCITLSRDGRFIASGSADRTVRIWDTVDGDEEALQPMQAHGDRVTSVAVSHDGSFIVSGSWDCSVRIWSARTGGARLPPLLGHSGPVTSVAISSDSRLTASGSDDKTVRVWDARTGVPIGDPLQGHSHRISAVAFAPDARCLASASSDDILRVWDVTTSAALFNLVHPGAEILAVAFALDGRLLAAAGSSGHVHLWLSGTDQPAREPIRVSSTSIRSVFFSPDSTRFGICGPERGVRIWDIESGHNVLSLVLEHAIYPYDTSAAYSPDGQFIVSSSSGKMVRIWDANNGAAVSTLPSHAEWVNSLAFTSDGIFIIFDTGKTIHTWDVEAALALSSAADDNPTVRLSRASLDKDGWLVGSSGELLLWVPPDYRGHIQLPPCLMIMGSYRVVLDADDGMHWGEQWTACWPDGPHSEPSSR